jgi:hypothetical protein
MGGTRDTQPSGNDESITEFSDVITDRFTCSEFFPDSAAEESSFLRHRRNKECAPAVMLNQKRECVF